MILFMERGKFFQIISCIVCKKNIFLNDIPRITGYISVQQNLETIDIVRLFFYLNSLNMKKLIKKQFSG